MLKMVVYSLVEKSCFRTVENGGVWIIIKNVCIYCALTTFQDSLHYFNHSINACVTLTETAVHKPSSRRSSTVNTRPLDKPEIGE